MSEKIVTLNEEVIKGEIRELVRGSVEETLNNLLEAEADRLTQAARYERSEDRQGYRSGHYDRGLTTTSGEVTLHVPRLKGISFEIHEFNAFVKPAWYADGVAILKELSRLGIESEVYKEKSRILDFQRKKTTQKVNLYENVQIPGYQEAIRKIKRYMEDEENLSKAASKIVKQRHAAEEDAEDGN